MYNQEYILVNKCETVDRIRGVCILISESKMYCLVHMYLYVCMCICKHICTY